MKIERISDNQIRCILNKNDFDQRDLRISELAYGSAKAKALFQDMMEQAAIEFGFETGDNIPLMIEAIPVSADCLILVVTKVEDPEELDTRFSRFTSSGEEEEDMMDMDMVAGEVEFEEDLPFGPSDSYESSGAEDEVLSFHDIGSDSASSEEGLDIMAPFNKAIAKAKEEVLKKKKGQEQPKMLSDEIYVFDSFETVIRSSSHLSAFYRGESILYKDTCEDDYYLMLLRENSDPKLYERACTICADHGEAITASYATPAFFKEHFQLICASRAVQTLSQLS